MNRMRAAGVFFWGSLLLCYLLQLMPLPHAILAFKPYWMALVLLYWALESPDRIGLGVAFMLGLLGDALTGGLLGEHALRLCVFVFIVLRFRARLRFFPMWQQALAVGALLLNDRILLLMIRACIGEPLPPPEFWLAPVTGMFAWPWVFLLLDDLRSRLRAHES